MYDQFYGFTKKPFSISPDPNFIYLNSDYCEALAMLEYGITQRKGIVCLIGEVGTGKTMLINKLLESVDQKVTSILLSCPELSYRELIEFVQMQLGVQVFSKNVTEQVTVLYKYLYKMRKENRTVVLIVDEAQSLSVKMLEFLRLLSNLETSEEKLLQILLAGQPELKSKLNLPELRQFKQRIAVSFRLGPLKPEEIPVYIAHRLNLSGCTMGLRLFSDDALTLIREYSFGIPRLINAICENALLIGFALSKRQINGAIIEEAAQDLMLEAPPALTKEGKEGTVPADVRVASLQPHVTSSPVPVKQKSVRAGGILRFFAGSAVISVVLWFVIAGWPLVYNQGLPKGWAEALSFETVHGFIDQNLAKIKNYLTLNRQDGAGPTAPEAAQKREVSTELRAETVIPQVRKGAIPSDASSNERNPKPLPVAPVNDVPLSSSRPAEVRNSTPVAGAGGEQPDYRVDSNAEAPSSTLSVPATPIKDGATVEIPDPAVDSPPADIRSEHQRAATAVAADASGAIPSPGRERDSKGSFALKTIRAGDTISKIAMEAYGFMTPYIWGLIRLANPEIENLDVIITGSILYLPPLTPESVIFLNHDGQYLIYLNAATDFLRAWELKTSIEKHADIMVDVSFNQLTPELGLYLLHTGSFITPRNALDTLKHLSEIPFISKIMEAKDEPDLRPVIKG